MSIDDCYKKGQLRRMEKDPAMVKRTLEMAIEDLAAAERSFSQGDHVWASVQTYASMLNFARALLFADGIREKSRFCVVEYPDAIWQKTLGTW